MTTTRSGSVNFAAMRDRAAEIIKADPEAVAWFRYGATYALSLIALVDFYIAAGREGEAHEVLDELNCKLGGADTPITIAHNLLRLGLYWDELVQVEKSRQAGLGPEEALNRIRKH